MRRLVVLIVVVVAAVGVGTMLAKVIDRVFKFLPLAMALVCVVGVSYVYFTSMFASTKSRE